LSRCGPRNGALDRHPRNIEKVVARLFGHPFGVLDWIRNGYHMLPERNCP